MSQATIGKVFLILVIGILILLLSLFQPFISSIVLAFLIAGACYPFYLRLKTLLKGRASLSALIMVLLIMLIFIAPASWFIGTLSKQAFDFYNDTKNSVSLQKMQEFLATDPVWAKRLQKAGQILHVQIDMQNINELAASVGKNFGLFMAKQLNVIGSNLINFFINFILMLLLIYYIFRDGTQLKNYIFELIPFPLHQKELIIEKFRETGKALILGNGLSGVLQGIFGGLGFVIFGLGSPFLWGSVITVFAFLPLLGASAIYLPACILFLIHGQVSKAIVFLIYNILYSSVIEYVVKPRLMGKSMKINSLLLFFAVLGGIKVFGLMGVIYGPLIITTFFALIEIYKAEYRNPHP